MQIELYRWSAQRSTLCHREPNLALLVGLMPVLRHPMPSGHPRSHPGNYLAHQLAAHMCCFANLDVISRHGGGRRSYQNCTKPVPVQVESRAVLSICVHICAAVGYAQEAICSVRERTSKARMAFLVGPLARVGGECIGLDGPVIIFGS